MGGEAGYVHTVQNRQEIMRFQALTVDIKKKLRMESIQAWVDEGG